MENTINKIFQIVNNKKNKKKVIIKSKPERKKTPLTSTKSKLLQHFNIDNSYTEKSHKVEFDKFDNLTYPVEDHNFSADLLYLPHYRGYKYLLVVVDNWSNEIDFEQIKNKEPKTVLKAFKKITERPYLNMPYASIRVDSGTEFKGVFKDFFYNESILLRVSIPNRHKQNAKAEASIRLISFILLNYLNIKEMEKQKEYNNWIELLPALRVKLNELRKRENKNPFDINNVLFSSVFKVPKYNIGDNVVHILETPINALGKKQNTNNKRIGDYIYSYNKPKKIVKILYYPDNIRYILEGLKRVSYTEEELLPYKNINLHLNNIP